MKTEIKWSNIAVKKPSRNVKLPILLALEYSPSKKLSYHYCGTEISPL
jgi:hypothetical protein